MSLGVEEVRALLGEEEARSLLGDFQCKVGRDRLHLPGPDFVSRVVADSDRPVSVLVNLQRLFGHGRLAGTGYLSLLPVDQGIEHSAIASFEPSPGYFDPENIVKLAIEGGCNGVASTLGVLGSVARKYAHRIPMIVKLNHNELLTYPNKYDQVMFAQVEQARDLGAVAVGATIYFGSAESSRQIQEVGQAFRRAHELGLVTVLWAYLRNPAFKLSAADHHTSADLTGQANYLAVTLEADIVKQKQATQDGGFAALNSHGAKFGAYRESQGTELSTPHPIDLVRLQVLHCYAGRIGLINSGGGSGQNDLAQAVRTAIINKRAGGMGMISGRKAFQKPMVQGVELLNAIQDVYLAEWIRVAD